MDVLPLLTKLSRYFQKDEVNLLVVKPVIQSTIQSLQQVKQHLDNETPEDNSIPCLKKLVSAVAGGSYMDQPLTATDGQKVQFFCHGKQFIQVLIDNLNEWFPKDALNVMTSLDVILNPQLLPRSVADIAIHGQDSLNTAIEHYRTPKQVADREMHLLLMQLRQGETSCSSSSWWTLTGVWNFQRSVD